MGPSSSHGWERWALDSLLMAFLLLLLLAAHFLYQWKSECHFLNGTQRVRYLDRDIYGREEVVRFDSYLGKHVAVTEWGQSWADYYNSNKVSTLALWICRNNYAVAKAGRIVSRKTKPTITISPTKVDPASPNTIFLCTVRGFYPLEIDIRWLKNGQLG